MAWASPTSRRNASSSRSRGWATVIPAGVGLGLAVAKGFAEAMGGDIMATDTAGGGLTVRVILAVASGDKSAPAPDHDSRP